jgi:hypothetical protein
MIRERVSKLWPYLVYHCVVALLLLHILDDVFYYLGDFASIPGTMSPEWIPDSQHPAAQDFRMLLLTVAALTVSLSVSRPDAFLSPVLAGVGMTTIAGTIEIVVAGHHAYFWFWRSEEPIYIGPLLAMIWYLVTLGIVVTASGKKSKATLAVAAVTLLPFWGVLQACFHPGGLFAHRYRASALENVQMVAICIGALAVIFFRLVIFNPEFSERKEVLPAEQADNC